MKRITTSEVAKAAGVSIGAASMDEQRLTEEAVSMLLKRIENPTADISSVSIPYASIPRPA